MALAAIALGSNLPGALGSREANLDAAVGALAALGKVEAQSAWFDTAPVGYLQQPNFLNGAVLLRTELPAHELLTGLLRTERDFGRDRSQVAAKGPRALDLDLLFYGDAVQNTPELVLPHPRLHERRFVLEPLAQIAPAWLHPIFRKSVSAMLAELS